MTGAAASPARRMLARNKWLLLRRSSQLGILALFLVGPLAGLWIVKGTLASSLTLGVLPLTDPYMLLQSVFAGSLPALTAWIGAVIMLVFYALIGGRVYCSWVCPINIVTDASHWLSERFDVPKGWQPKRTLRRWILGMTLVVSAITGVIVWELVNPITLLYRGVLYGVGLAWAAVLAVFLFDLFVSRRGWCGHLCPVGAFYALAGWFALLRINAVQRTACDDCMECYAVCPEPHVITPALKGGEKGGGSVILSSDCSNCGRCIDVCDREVFRFSSRFAQATDAMPQRHRNAA
ncbi:MAG: quinol dehydrogenase ferredoxin subunit NapH [Rhodospirillales bacterium]|nr:MAG: quinol dehydrogenase ferredoxin subunit NapH [Rhodospirillales bacterium]